MAEEALEQHDSADHDSHEGADPRMRRKHELRMYARFGAMIATSTTVMFLLTYTNAYAGFADLAENGPATTREDAEARPVPQFTGELDPAE